MRQAGELTTGAGRAHPLGVSHSAHGTNFSIYARETTDVTLLLRQQGATQPTKEVLLHAATNRSGLVWHVEVRPPLGVTEYAWRVGRPDPRWKSNVCLDPYARALTSGQGAHAFNARSTDYAPWAVVIPPEDAASAFDWQDVVRPNRPWCQLIVYEMHVRGFSIADGAGTFAGIVERIPYLLALGITAVELLPVMEFNEEEWSARHPQTGRPLCQYWGYSTVAFFAPMNRFARRGDSPVHSVREFQYMVRELHRVGIEVILDVVYNHTAEMGDDFVGPGFYGMKQLAPFSYYILKDDGSTFVNHSGCGNTVNCNNLAVQDLICDSLKYWAHELHVDGFRFDLASILTRGTDGEPLALPPLIERMAKDVSMRDIKLIAEPWDCGGLYQVGRFPHYGVFAEWNGKFRDAVRRFVNGQPGAVGEFATRLCGSQDLYGDGRRPYHSINFITAHDGFTLLDLASFDHKHNDANGENNNDGEAHNISWNCGAEGVTHDAGILALRQRQVRNFLVALFVSAGTPMLNMGDEYGHSRGGNNNTWCQDGELSWFDWQKAKGQAGGLLRFTSGLIGLRKRWRTLQKDDFLSDRDVTWHGVNNGQPDWNSGYNFLAMTLRGDCDLFVAFNCGPDGKDVQLPAGGSQWARVIDTNLEAPKDFSALGHERRMEPGSRYGMAPHSCLLLRKMSGDGGGGDSGDVLDVATAFDKMSAMPTDQL